MGSTDSTLRITMASLRGDYRWPRAMFSQHADEETAPDE
jgi:hypothetical protein